MPIPRPMRGHGLEEHEYSKLRFPLLASPKIDGIRGLAMEGRLYSRNGILLPNKHLQAFATEHDLHGHDMEITIGLPWASDCYKRTRGPVMSRDQPINEILFHVFDNWAEGWMPWKDRQFTTLPHPKMVAVPQMLVHNWKELSSVEEHTLGQGFEGLMLRSPTATYKHGQSTLKEQFLLKLKRFVDDEGEVIGWEERMENQNEATTNAFGLAKRSTAAGGKVPLGDLGAFRVRVLTGRFSGVEVSVGGGYNAAERKAFWTMREQLLGKTLTFKHFLVGADVAPRFPIFKSFRED